MRIDELHIRGFRGIRNLSVQLHPQFSLLIGENGSGKTAILEAIAVAMGAYFLGMPGVRSRSIRDEDIGYFKTPEGSLEYVASTRIEVKKAHVASLTRGMFEELQDSIVAWHKERAGIAAKTRHGDRSPIKAITQDIHASIANPDRRNVIDLPLLAHYSTARLWKEGRENETDDNSAAKSLPSRYRGYRDALEIRSNFRVMLDWFKGKYSDMRVGGTSTDQLDCVRKVVLANVPGASDMRWVFDSDKINTLYLSFADGSETPFSYLSDGYRNLLAIFADLAYRCVTLNPHLGVEANLKTKGMVLIDELDLHLHPAWQRRVVSHLKHTFPMIQFVATTHSPFILQEMEDDEVFRINSPLDATLSSLRGMNRMGIEDIAEDIQHVDTPYMSTKRIKMFQAAERYYEVLNKAATTHDPTNLQVLKDELDSLMELYSDDVAYYAFLKQERLSRGL